MWILLIAIIVIVIAIFILIRGKNASIVRYTNALPRVKQNHSQEYLRIISSIDSMSYEELDHMHEVLLDYVLKIPLLDCYLPADVLRRNVEEFKCGQIEDGPIYGCYTYGEADELNKAIVKRLDYLDKNR